MRGVGATIPGVHRIDTPSFSFRTRFQWAVVLACAGVLVAGAPTLAAAPFGYEDDQLRVRIYPRSRDQMAAFYEARKFPSSMLNIIADYCFFTFSILNKGAEVLWLDTTAWRFVSDGEERPPEPRAQWPARWRALGVPLSAQSTFRWTLLPETLDLMPGEQEGGNILLPRGPGIFSLRAPFALGTDGGKMIDMRVDGLACAADDQGAT